MKHIRTQSAGRREFRRFRDFRKLWRRWVRVLEHYARSRVGYPMKSRDYLRLREELMREARHHADCVPDVMRSGFARLEFLPRAWRSLECLASADRMLLVRELAAARRAELYTFGYRTVWKGIRLAVALLAVSLLVLVGTWAVSGVSLGQGPAAELGDLLLIEFKRASWRLLSHNDPWRLTLAGLVCLLIAAWMVSATPRY